MARNPTHNTIPTRKPSVLTLLKRGDINAFYDAYAMAAWLLLSAVACGMAAWIVGAW